MNECVLCGDATEKEQMHCRKKEKLQRNVPQLQDKELYARFCPSCGHVMYTQE